MIYPADPDSAAIVQQALDDIAEWLQTDARTYLTHDPITRRYMIAAADA